MFNKIMLNEQYNLREEDDKILFFSGYDRALHFISKDAYALIEVALTHDFEWIVSTLSNNVNNTNDVKNKLEEFFLNLKSKNIIVFK